MNSWLENISDLENVLSFNSFIVGVFIIFFLGIFMLVQRKFIISFQSDQIGKNREQSLAAYLFGEDEEKKEAIQQLAADHKISIRKQELINDLIILKKTYTGEASDNIIKLYHTLGLERTSRKKIKSIFAHKRIKGMQELINFDNNNFTFLEKTFEKNKTLKMGALEVYTKIKGYTILDEFSESNQSIPEWKQMIMVNALLPQEFIEVQSKMRNYLFHQNESFTLLILKLYHKNQTVPDKEAVVYLLKHQSKKVRLKTFRILKKFATDKDFPFLVPRLQKFTSMKDQTNFNLNLADIAYKNFKNNS